MTYGEIKPVNYSSPVSLVPPHSRRILPCCATRTALLITLFAACGATLFAAPLSLRHGNNGVHIVTGPAPSQVDQFAASELARYLGKMSGAKFVVETASRLAPEAIVVGRDESISLDSSIAKEDLGEDGFVIRQVGRRVLIAGASDRGTLYGVYAFLEKLGCRWFAPNFSFYGSATGEFVPHIQDPAVNDWNVVEKPAFKWRKLYVEEGWSHTEENLKQMVDWMAKARMNVLDCPIDYQHLHRTEWDHWRSAITPELRKRGMLIEVGGHGYPNFLSTEKYFAQHPEWFGMYEGKRSADPREVFSTSNPDAVNTFVANVRSYLRTHPEIDILDVWPPDGARWSDAPEDLALGSPSERQMLLLNHLYQELKAEFPKLRLQFIAYQVYTVPPSEHKPDPGVLMEFCPINRSFESPLYASDYPQSEEYFHDLQGWLKGVMDPSNISIYSYITKYAWRSYPVLIPHLIVDEARRFHNLGIGGMSTYSEPGNWATFELDHYITARALWNPQLNTHDELVDYTSHRYGPAGPAVLQYLNLIEQVVPHAIGIPGTQLTIEKQRMMLRDFAPTAGLLKQAHAAAASDAALQLLLAKLDHANEYVQNEMEMRLAILVGGQGLGSNRLKNLQNLLADRERIVSSDREDGVILQDNRTP
ncbi:MAG TPA: DUF4838 domain-containing protein [Bryocella sp.]|nr:DUF4838 domain-containing protein [Bryocella sp.]